MKANGLSYTALSAIGRKNRAVWNTVGPSLTAGAFNRYLENVKFPRLNLGSGSNRIDGMFNVDVDPRADAFVDVTKQLPFPDGLFEAVFSEEVLEHINRSDGQALLSECYRIMRPGSVIRLTTPSLEYFCTAFMEGQVSEHEVNDIFYNHGHRFIYSRRELTESLAGAGFEAIRFTEYKDPDSVLGYLDSHADRFGEDPRISHYVEARKPTTAP